jgi:hypothetical protein
MKRIAIVAACLVTFFLNGCQNNEMVKKSVADELQQKNVQLENELSKVTSQRDQLKEQNNVLTSLGQQKVTAENIYSLEGIRISRYSGFYDRDNDGIKESLIVYIQPVDVNGEVVKAIGDVQIELWNLEKKDRPMLKQWQVGPEELKKNWYSVLTSNYRLVFDTGQIAAETKDDLTLKVKFIDHLSGKVFKSQYLITNK